MPAFYFVYFGVFFSSGIPVRVTGYVRTLAMKIEIRAIDQFLAV